MSINLSTVDIVVEFMNNHFQRSDLGWRFKDKDEKLLTQENIKRSERNQAKYQEKLEQVSTYLNEISKELFDFIRDGSYNSRFDEMTSTFMQINTSNNNINSDANNTFIKFTLVADGLFAGSRIDWINIVTFLSFGADVACRVIKEIKKDNKKECYEVVLQIISCMCRYIDKNLMKWIMEQDGDWLSLKQVTNGSGTRARHFNDSHNKTIGQYLGIGALVALLGGLYICSRFSVQ